MEFIAGPNFSGRSAALMARLREMAPAFFIGPYAEAALSGLSSTVADEIGIYRAPQPRHPAFTRLDFAAYAARKPATLSGGEQMLLALHCFSMSDYAAIGIDTALEQLDPENRAQALEYLSQDAQHGLAASLVDNRLDASPGWSVRSLPGTSSEFACDFAAIAPRSCRAPVFAVHDLCFHYPRGSEIFSDLSFVLTPGNAYRLTGPNGAGKTTLFKLLAGVLAPVAGRLALDGGDYAPWRTGNRVFAFAAQNPDHQWCGATLAEDIARRRTALARHGIELPPAEALGALAASLGIRSIDQHLYELPLVARKRLSWLWPLSGVMPWIMLDEPTLGQDRATREMLAGAIGQLAQRGYGVMFITHDDEFAERIPHQALRLANQTVLA